LNVLFISCAFYRSEVEYFTVLKTSTLFQTSPTEYMFNYTAKCFFLCLAPHSFNFHGTTQHIPCSLINEAWPSWEWTDRMQKLYWFSH